MRTVELSDATLHYVDQGEGPVLLLVHGFPLDHRMWSRQIDALSVDYRVIAPDLRGFGASSGVSEVLKMECFADDLAELLRRLNVEQPVVFCGLSMGGYVAWQFFRRHRRHLAALILCDTRAAADTEQVAQGRSYLAARVLAEGTRGTSEEMLQKLFAASSLDSAPELARQILAVMSATDPQTVAAALRGMAQRPDMSGLLADIDCPTLVLCGQDDQITPAAEMQTMAGQIPGARFQAIPGAGHLAPLENPAAVNGAIQDFLRRDLGVSS